MCSEELEKLKRGGSFKELPPRCFLPSNVWVSGFQSCLLSHLFPLSYFLLFSYIFRLPWLDLLIEKKSSAASGGNFDSTVCFDVCLGKCMCVHPRQNGSERYWICTRTVRYGIDFFFISCFYILGGFLILGFKGKQITFRVSFALVFGGVHFAVAELFSLTNLYSETIFYTAPSVTRLWLRFN